MTTGPGQPPPAPRAAPPLSLRQVRVIAAVAQQASLARASEWLHLSQSSLSRTIADAEHALGCSLFQRGWAGMEPTAPGAVVIPRCHRMMAAMATAQAALAAGGGRGGGPGQLGYHLTWPMLDAAEAVQATGSTSAAALYLGTSQSTISRLLAQLGAVLGRPAFARTASGMVALGDVGLLCDLRARLLVDVMSLPQALLAARQDASGRVEVGILPFSEQDMVVSAFVEMLETHRHVHLRAVTGGYGALTDALMKGAIDVILGPLRQPAPLAALEEITLFDEWLTVVARADHPLAGARVRMADLVDQTWVIGPRGTPTRHYFEDLLARLGLPMPERICEMVTFPLAEQMVLASGALGLLTFSQRKRRALAGGLVALGVDLPESRRRIGLTVRRHQPLTPAQNHFVEILQRQAGVEG
jgi:LysR family transcriptional regulator, regulator for genes of the gallate degradation pathway